MKIIKLIFFDEIVDIEKPKDFLSLKNEIAKINILNPLDVSQLLIYYKNNEIIRIENNEDYKTFFNLNIDKIYLEVRISSQLFQKHLEIIKNEKKIWERCDDIKIKRKITKIAKPILENKNDSTNQTYNDKRNFHYGIKCNNCNEIPIKGCRYKCIKCDNFNICSKCETKIGIIHMHPLIKMNSPKFEPMVLKLILRNNANID